MTLVNGTQSDVLVNLTITIHGESGALSDRTWNLGPGEVVDTAEQADISGESGASLFQSNRDVRVLATTNGRVIFERTFTYDEVKGLDFRIEISDPTSH